MQAPLKNSFLANCIYPSGFPQLLEFFLFCCLTLHNALFSFQGAVPQKMWIQTSERIQRLGSAFS
jgi:hypothetical protein